MAGVLMWIGAFSFSIVLSAVIVAVLGDVVENLKGTPGLPTFRRARADLSALVRRGPRRSDAPSQRGAEPPAGTHPPGEQLRNDIVYTLAHDQDLPTDVRLASLLIATFGLPATQVLALRREHLRTDGDSPYLLIKHEPLKLPDHVAPLARAQLDRHADAGPSDWLFPGQIAPRSRDPRYLNEQLRPLDISISTLRSIARELGPAGRAEPAPARR